MTLMMYDSQSGIHFDPIFYLVLLVQVMLVVVIVIVAWFTQTA